MSARGTTKFNEDPARPPVAAPVGIGMVWDRTITQANDQLCRMTGYTRDELIGQDARIFYPSDEAYAYVGREKYARIAVNGVGQSRRSGGGGTGPCSTFLAQLVADRPLPPP